MPDHVHFFARRATIAQPMAKWMQMWKSVSSRQFAAALDIAPPIWQPDYFDRYLRSRENYGQKWNYVEQNALRAGLIKEGGEWPYRAVRSLISCGKHVEICSNGLRAGRLHSFVSNPIRLLPRRAQRDGLPVVRERAAAGD